MRLDVSFSKRVGEYRSHFHDILTCAITFAYMLGSAEKVIFVSFSIIDSYQSYVIFLIIYSSLSGSASFSFAVIKLVIVVL